MGGGSVEKEWGVLTVTNYLQKIKVCFKIEYIFMRF